MNKNIVTLLMIITAISFVGASVAIGMENNSTFNPDEIKTMNIEESHVILNLSSEGPRDLKKGIEEIKTSELFEGYNEDTVKWMESLNETEFFISNNGLVIMNKTDANKLNSEYATDVDIREFIDCVVVENRSLCTNHTKNILLVRNVTYIGNYTYFYDV
ncbi:MAG: hypothetical protein BZ137_09330 [Methanosphaera sp. rholeuAM130]|nr:hypothetical protein [Methanosphaera sp.]RAP52036.1 MAG: hypothetical protein BZ137_09330 [Methanosphaera sp. rholeuAM130]